MNFLHRLLSEKHKTEKSLTCLTYTNFLLDTANHHFFEESFAALLPCFWIYREVGLYIRKNSSPNNPYQTWIDTYAGEDFHLCVEKAISISNKAAKLASNQTWKNMENLFVKSTQLEWAFWDSVYDKKS